MKRSLPILFNGIVQVTIGVLLLLSHNWRVSLTLILGVFLAAYAVVVLLLYLIRRNNGTEDTLLSFVVGNLALVLGILLIVSPSMANIFVEKAVSVWLLLTGLVYLLNVYTYLKDHDVMWIPSLIIAAFSIGLGIATWSLVPLWGIMIGIVIPVYLILLGLSNLAGQLRSGVRSPRIPSLLFADAFLPRALADRLDSIKTGPHKQRAGEIPVAETETNDIEILIHISKRPDTFWGHVDVAFENYVFTYGNYDLSKKSKRLFGLLGDGVFVICPRGAYIDLAVNMQGKTLFGYQLTLSKDERRIFAGNAKHFLTYCIPWEPQETDRIVNELSWAMKEQGAYLYKVIQTRFQTFSGLSTNCALLTEVLFKGTAMPRARSIGGIVTPGAMLSLFEKELRRPGSIVVSKKEYAGRE